MNFYNNLIRDPGSRNALIDWDREKENNITSYAKEGISFLKMFRVWI